MMFNPLDKFYKSTIGAIKEDTKLTLRVKGNFTFVNLVIRSDDRTFNQKVALSNLRDFFECKIKLEVGLYFYFFETNKGNIVLGQNYFGDLSDNFKEFQLSVYSKKFQIPSFLDGGIIYQIFPDRFYNSNPKKIAPKGKVLHKDLTELPNFLPNEQGEILNNDFFGGDLKGIIEKLPYIKSLNVNAIYLNPIYKAYSNHRYDIGDYLEIDELLGDKNDLVELISKAKELGIKIILDGVFNHTGSDSKYFNKNGNYKEIGAFESKNSKYYDWYTFKDYPLDYESWWGIKTLPAINKQNEEFIKFITGEDGVIAHYLGLGAYGIRLDVVDELPSNFVKKIRNCVKKANKDAIIIGEVWEDASNKISYGVRRQYFLGNELDSVMNYPLKDAIINFVKTGDVEELSYVIKSQLDHYPKLVLNSLMNFLSTHDTFRLVSSLSNVDANNISKSQMAKINFSKKEIKEIFSRVKVATLLQYTIFGAVSIYYGDEVGMAGFLDPLNRKYFEWEKLNNNFNKWYKKLGKLRKDYSALRQGDLEILYATNGALIFTRKDKSQQLLIAVNLSNCPLKIEFKGELTEVLSNKSYKKIIELKKGEYGIFKK